MLIFPPAFSGYGNIIGKQELERLKTWIEAGGTAIGIGSGAEFLADVDRELTRTRLRRQALDKFPPVVLGASPGMAEQAGPFRAVGIRAPTKDTEDDDDHDAASKRPSRSPAAVRSPYDVAPLLGPGARPFAEGLELGTPADTTPVDLANWLKPFLAPGQSKPDERDLERGDERLRRFSPRGAILRIELDRDVWLAWGMPETVPALIRSRGTLVAAPPVQVAARFAEVDRLHLGGLLWPEAAGRLARTAYATREARGRGQVVLFLNEPEFRGWTLATRRLLVNAILYGPGLGTRWSHPW